LDRASSVMTVVSFVTFAGILWWALVHNKKLISLKRHTCRSTTKIWRRNMADFTNSFWDLYIVVLTMLGIIGCACCCTRNRKLRASPVKPPATCGMKICRN
jgi:TRAP-type C4-dicarboxylate transport system permease large subunit